MHNYTKREKEISTKRNWLINAWLCCLVESYWDIIIIHWRRRNCVIVLWWWKLGKYKSSVTITPLICWNGILFLLGYGRTWSQQRIQLSQVSFSILSRLLHDLACCACWAWRVCNSGEMRSIALDMLLVVLLPTHMVPFW